MAGKKFTASHNEYCHRELEVKIGKSAILQYQFDEDLLWGLHTNL